MDYARRAYCGPVGKDGSASIEILITENVTAEEIADLRDMLSIIDRQLERFQVARLAAQQETPND